MNGESIYTLLTYTWRIYKMYKQTTAITKGLCIGMAAGAAAAVIGTQVVKNNKKTIRKTANKALHAVGSFMDNVDGMLRR